MVHITAAPTTFAPRPGDETGLRAAESRFWSDAEKWTRLGSGMTKEQRTGASMVFAWLNQQARAAVEAAMIAGLMEDAEADRQLVREWDETLPSSGRP